MMEYEGVYVCSTNESDNRRRGALVHVANSHRVHV